LQHLELWCVDWLFGSANKSLLVGKTLPGADQLLSKSLDLPPLSRTNVMERKSINQENDGHEEEQIHPGTDHWIPQAG
jgi:hypothetical protein